MSRNVSPLFAVIVILLAVAIGFLSFMFRLRSYDAAEKREAQMLQAQADAQRRSGMASGTLGRRGGRMRGANRGAAPGQKPGAAPGGPSKSAGATTEKPGAAAPAEPEAKSTQ